MANRYRTDAYNININIEILGTNKRYSCIINTHAFFEIAKEEGGIGREKHREKEKKGTSGR